jgi:hypothetical protein
MIPIVNRPDPELNTGWPSASVLSGDAIEHGCSLIG